MSQYLQNIIELLRTVNEVYFITAPERVRAAYILVDDLVELSLKTFLYEHTLSQREQCRADFQATGWLTSDAKRKAVDACFAGDIDIAGLAAKLNFAEQVVRRYLAPYCHTPEQQANYNAPQKLDHMLSETCGIMNSMWRTISCPNECVVTLNSSSMSPWRRPRATKR